MQRGKRVRGGRKDGGVTLQPPHVLESGIFGRLRKALQRAPANEVEQSILRVRRTLYFFAYGVMYGWIADENVVLWFICASAFLVLGVALFVWLYLFPFASGFHRHFRLVFYVVADHAIGTVGMIVYGPWAMVLYCIYQLVDVGNAARYGRVYHWISVSLSVVGWLCVINLSGYWQSPEMHPIAYALLLNLLVTPLYSNMFMQRLRQANDELMDIAIHDQLTRLPNRPHLYERLNEAIAAAEQHKTSFVVLFLDIDNFKVINDSRGHAAGDEALKGAAAVLKKAVRQSDTIARMGGDEFVLIMREPPVGALQTLAEKLREALERNTAERLSASIGIAVYPHCGTDAESLVRHADKAMYLAKRAGKRLAYICPDFVDRRTGSSAA